MTKNKITKFLWILPLFIALLSNLSVLENQFVWDDYNIFEHQLPVLKDVKDLFFPAEKIPEIATHYFRPFTLASYKIDQMMWGEGPRGFHLSVLLSHIFNVLLVYILALLIASKIQSRYIIALFSSTLFAVHPIHAEVVAWICGRNESFSTNFALLALISYALFRQKEKRAFLFTSAFFFLVALFFKELAASVLFLIPVYDLCFTKRCYSPLTNKRENFSLYALFGGVFVIYYILREISLGSFGLTILKSETNTMMALVSSVGYYLKVSFWPIELNFFITDIPSSKIFFFVSLLTLITLTYTAIKSFAKKRIITYCILFFILALLPSLAIAIMYISEVPLALRYLYFPSVGFAIALGYLLGGEQSKLKWVLFFTIFIFYQQINMKAIRVWKDDVTLWTDASEKSPHAGLVYNELGRTYALAGENEKAIEYSKKALNTKYDAEGKSIACNTIGYNYMQLNKLDKAAHWFKEAIKYRPNTYALPHYNLGFIGIRQEEELSQLSGDQYAQARGAILTQSISYFKKAIEIHSQYYKARYYLGVCYVKLGQHDLAKKQLRELLELDPPGEFRKLSQDILRQYSQDE